MSRYPRTTLRRVAHARALMAAFTSSKTTAAAPTRGLRAGRIDRTRLARLGVGDYKVFTSPLNPKPQRLRVTVLIDGSGSMEAYMNGTYTGSGPKRTEVAQQVARDLAEAMTMLPRGTVMGKVYAHGTATASPIPGRQQGQMSPSLHSSADNMEEGTAVLFPLWQQGEPTENVDRYSLVRYSGNIDHLALEYVALDLLDEVNPAREQALIIIISDGAPGDQSMVKMVVDDIRRKGVEVVSVSIAPEKELKEAQAKMYGAANVVQYNANVNVMAKEMAKVMGRML